MVYLVVIEVIWVVICILIAKNMVAKRSGIARSMVIGKDNEQTIEKMKKLAKQIIYSGKFEMSEQFDGYEVKIKAQEGCVGEVEIASPATRVFWHFYNGWRTQNVAWSEKGAVAMIAAYIWALSSMIQMFLGMGISAVYQTFIA